MPYISTEQVAKVRVTLKNEFPTLKLSVSRRDSMVVKVAILEGDIDFGADYEQVNEFHIDRNYEGEIRKTLQRIRDIMNDGNFIQSTDSDYGNIPKFYLSLSIGNWDRPYKQKK